MVDMHIHTNNSDGEYTTIEIIEMLKKIKVELFSITDHDNINSCYEIEKIEIPQNTIYIPGIEFSSKLDEYNCHILGYNFDYKNKLIENECKTIKQKKLNKILKIIEHLNDIGIEITEEEKNSILNKKGTIGRMDLCRMLMSKGYGERKEIYDKYLKTPNLIQHRSKTDHIIEIINNADGVSVLAHPKEIEEDYNINIESIIEKFLNIGLDGIEVYNSIHTLKDVKRYLEISKKYNLITTAGSDFHGSSYPERIIGTTTTKHKKINTREINFHI